MIEDVMDALSDWWYDYKEIIIFLLMTVLIIGGLIWFVAYGNYRYCERLETLAPQYEFDFSFWGGCLVKTESGYWTNAGEYFKRLELVPMEK